MVMTRNVAVGSIVAGSVMIAALVVSVICGIIAVQKFTGEAAASAGLWSIYFIVPGVLSIVAGATKNGIVMGFALFFNIIAVIVSSAAAVVCIISASLLNQVANFDDCKPVSSHKCSCPFNDNDPYTTSTETWNVSCKDIQTIHSLVLAMVVVYVIMSITTFIASIYGCMGTCCAPVDPVVIVTSGVPVQGGGTIVVSNQSSMHSGYAGYPGGYVQAPPPVYGYGDKQGLVQNMAI